MVIYGSAYTVISLTMLFIRLYEQRVMCWVCSLQGNKTKMPNNLLMYVHPLCMLFAAGVLYSLLDDWFLLYHASPRIAQTLWIDIRGADSLQYVVTTVSVLFMNSFLCRSVLYKQESRCGCCLRDKFLYLLRSVSRTSIPTNLYSKYHDIT